MTESKTKIITRRNFVKKFGCGLLATTVFITCHTPESNSKDGKSSNENTDTSSSNSSSSFSTMSFEINFSKSMNTASVENGISITPDIMSSISNSPVWSDGDTKVLYTFNGDIADQVYTVNISGTVQDIYSNLLDGDKNGLPGDAYSFTIQLDQIGSI